MSANTVEDIRKHVIQDIDTELFEEILRARTRVYHVGDPTPIQLLPLGQELTQGCDVYVKREDLGPINAYKWRGGYNATFVHTQKQIANGDSDITVVAASAGNHAQGVAMAATKLGIQAKIFMPLATPLMKQTSVKKHGGDHVDIILTGDTYNEAGDAAKSYCKEHGHTYIHPFDDLYTIAGQATIADEVMLDSQGPFDIAFVQIGGGGMAAGVASWLKLHNPDIKVIGVEGVDQASMKASLAAKKPITINNVDTFCDGTAVTRPGDLTFAICQKHIDEIITVTNEEVCAAIQRCWEGLRVIPEPSGAMGLAGLIQYAESYPEKVQSKKLLSIICGANMDFGKLSLVASKSAIGAHQRRYVRFHMEEKTGGLLGLLEEYFKDISVSEFLYGKLDDSKAWPTIALDTSPETMQALEEKLTKAGMAFEDVTLDPDVRYKIINYNPALFKNPLLMHVHFPERKGALRDFLRTVSEYSSICYFNYAYSGESIGRALMGFEFESDAAREKFQNEIKDSVVNCRPVEDSVAKRILQK